MSELDIFLLSLALASVGTCTACFLSARDVAAENAKLREQGARLFDKTLKLGTENAKLRELVTAFDWCTENFDMRCKCDLCPLPQSDALEPECEVWMHELGIESGN